MHLATELQEKTVPVLSLTTGKRFVSIYLESDRTNVLPLHS